MKPFRSHAMRRAAAGLAMACVSLAPAASRGGPTAQTIAGAEFAKHIQGSIVRFNFGDAHRELGVAQVFGADPHVALERGRLALYELDCDGAAAILARPEVQRTDDGEMLADIARGCQRVTASLTTSEDRERGIEVHWQDDNDAPLAPLLFDTVATARESLTRDLGVDWPLPTRIVVVRDLLSLSAMTGLPYDSARTTGTVAVAKWGRVTLLSPRATPHGFPWRDTVAHELTHLAVTRATGDRAPLWLQEGVAKREEIRWRDPGPFDNRPPADAIAQQGVERGLAVHLDQLGPSIAMLPTAEQARVAFAEVTSFIEFYLQQQGDGALPKLFKELSDGRNPDAALLAASGTDFKTWDARWRVAIESRPRLALPPLLGGQPSEPGEPGKGGAGGESVRRHNDVASLRELRDRARLAELLLSRGHGEEALDELRRIDPTVAPAGAAPGTISGNEAAGSMVGAGELSADATARGRDPSIVWLHGRALEMLGRASDLAPLVSDTDRVVSSYGPWWALRERWAAARGDEGAVRDSSFEGLAADPLDFEVACGTADREAPAASLSGAVDRALCDAARARGEPPFNGD